MSNKGKRKIRKNQTITPYGVGAILDISGQSFVAADVSEWKGAIQRVPDTTSFAQRLGVDHLRSAPETPDGGFNKSGVGVPYIRFPKQLFCPAVQCRQITTWKTFQDERQLLIGEEPSCKLCTSQKPLVPMRFVLICGDGHLQDVDWWWFAHMGTKCETRGRLKFLSKSASSGGLSSLSIKCEECNTERRFDDLEGFTFKCHGEQPWFVRRNNPAKTDCEKRPKVVQRGASNVYFPSITSMLDIPPYSNHDYSESPNIKLQNNPEFTLLLMNANSPLRAALINKIISDEGLTEDEILKALSSHLGSDSPPAIVDLTEESILRDEWRAFTDTSHKETHFRDRFITESVTLSSAVDSSPDTNSLLAGHLSNLVKVKRLREIRVLRGFHRYTMEAMVPADLRTPQKELPAIAVFGEGIFLSLEEHSLQKWENDEFLHKRIAVLETRRQGSFFFEMVPELSPRFVLLHTLSHLLIRELTYGSGYSSSAIQERLYVGKGAELMAGILLYTAEGDSEGTLGGLARCGDLDLFLPLILQALKRAEWCSLDPVCGESFSQGPDGLSLAACHACALISETSCRVTNSALDRNLLIHPKYGYFRQALNQANLKT